MLFVAIIVIFGLVTKQPTKYWWYSLMAVAVQTTAGFLFYAGGSLDDPSGDGLITGMVRQASNDGPEVLFMLPFAMILGWGVPIWLVVRGYTPKNKRIMNQE
ncbi:MAG: hypothetical protein OXU98_08330 [Gammaproteobacteria bacterium]|nr:hypothetical protein [Gammaproteobacteria bacterium]